jgi:hypothetical protein
MRFSGKNEPGVCLINEEEKGLPEMVVRVQEL